MIHDWWPMIIVVGIFALGFVLALHFNGVSP